MKEALLWERLDGKRVRCNLCARRCILKKGQTGFCLVRKNVNGTLYSLNYGKLIAANVDPIEKKPLFHFLPGAFAFSISSAGCNFRCAFCQNWEISQVYREGLASEIVGEEYKPEEIVKLAMNNGCKAISYTYTEPTIFFEFAYDVSKLAAKHRIANTFVTNGYMTPEAVKTISKYLHATTVDFKGNASLEFYRKYSLVPKIDPIFDSLLEMHKRKIFIEITDLVIPKIGDSEDDFKKLVRWIIENLGNEVPFHILRFYPHYRLSNLPPTPVKTLEKLWRIAKEEGLKYVYLGNVPGTEKENTYCPQCGNLLIERRGFYSEIVGLDKKGRCKKCGEKIPIVLKV